MNYLDYIGGFQRFPRLGLERMEMLMTLLKNPQDVLKVIHVAGTNGKGSVCAVLYSILTCAGYKTGRYTSPDLIRVNERIHVCGRDITDAELEQVLEEVRPAVEKASETLGEMPSRFEVATAAALLYFARSKCDFVVLETGLGGRLDATNICKKPLVSVITTIDMDHLEYLGKTIESIAFEKAGIIKNGVPVVSAPQQPEAAGVISKICAERKSPLTVIDEAEIKSAGFEGMNEIFEYKSFKGLKCGLAGPHQVVNAAVALGAAGVLQAQYGINIPESAVYDGVLSAVNRGRLELLGTQPLIIFDGAHNPSGARWLAQSLKRYFAGRKFNFVMAVMADKDVEGMLQPLKSLANRFIATEVPGNARSLSAETLCKRISSAGLEACCVKDCRKAAEMARNCGDAVIFGSLYLYKHINSGW